MVGDQNVRHGGIEEGEEKDGEGISHCYDMAKLNVHTSYIGNVLMRKERDRYSYFVGILNS